MNRWCKFNITFRAVYRQPKEQLRKISAKLVNYSGVHSDLYRRLRTSDKPPTSTTYYRQTASRIRTKFDLQQLNTLKNNRTKFHQNRVDTTATTIFVGALEPPPPPNLKEAKSGSQYRGGAASFIQNELAYSNLARSQHGLEATWLKLRVSLL